MIKIQKMCLFILFSFIPISVFTQQSAPDSQSINTNNINELINEALQNNPRLKAARNQTLAQRTKIDQATAWDPPQVGVSLFQTPIQSFPNPFKNGMETDYYIQQMFPFPGKMSSIGKAAENNAAMYEEQYKGMEKNIIEELKSTYYELYFVQKKIEINKENQSLLEQLSNIAAKQYEVGTGKQADMLRAQTELSILINDGVNLEKGKRNVETILNTILNRQPDSSFPEIPSIEDTVPDWNYKQLSDLAIESRPELKAMQYNIEMNKSELAASKLEYYPDIMVQLMYKNMSNTSNDFWSTMIGVNIPIAFWSKDKFTGKVEENQINISVAQDQYNSDENMVEGQVQDALIKIQSNKNLVDLYGNTVIPQAQQTLQSTLSEYQTGNTQFLMLIDAYKMVLMAKQDYYMSQMNYMQSQALLEQAVGLNIDQIKERIK
jgi:outer membrane protein, heavy metal efflux system